MSNMCKTTSQGADTNKKGTYMPFNILRPLSLILFLLLLLKAMQSPLYNKLLYIKFSLHVSSMEINGIDFFQQGKL